MRMHRYSARIACQFLALAIAFIGTACYSHDGNGQTTSPPDPKVLEYLHARFDAELAGYSQEAKTDFDGLIKRWYPEPPPKENAAETYELAFPHVLHNAKGSGNLSRFFPASLRVPSWARFGIKKRLQKDDESLKLLHDAAALKHYRYPIDFAQYLQGSPAQTAQGPLNHTKALRESARLLCLETLYYTDTGDTQSAAKAGYAALALCSAAATEPDTLSQLTRAAAQLMVFMHVEDMLNRCQLNAEELKPLSEELQELDAPEAYRRAEFLGDYLLKANLDSATKEEMRDSVANVDPQTLASVEAFRKEMRDITVINDAEMLAFSRTARTAVAAERFRVARGKLPETLDELVPDFLESVPVDPFDGNSIRYKKLSRGFVVYSIGKNGKDDGGDFGLMSEQRTRPPDLTFMIRR
ncbi:MAG: hypothetical protein HY706_14580 [Candidatus Hydrogenedentes bacterium]|nr:hypothetical protein [Candidatus Hydrogenedentota bacterium]